VTANKDCNRLPGTALTETEKRKKNKRVWKERGDRGSPVRTALFTNTNAAGGRQKRGGERWMRGKGQTPKKAESTGTLKTGGKLLTYLPSKNKGGTSM